MREIMVDNFAGGGGASLGIKMATGREPDYAVNHDFVALAVHAVNHPETEHLCKNVWKVIPSDISKGRPIGLAWFSPDCKHFSKAKGGKPADRNIRDLGWVVISYAKLGANERPRVIFLENVEEWQDWGPLVDGVPCKDGKGRTFKRWVSALRRYGYRVEWKLLRARDFGAPTNRRRLFVIARCDGKPIVWPKPTHGKPDSLPVTSGRLLPWRTAADSVIDWSIPCPSIFATSEEIRDELGTRAIRPLADATMARVAKGTHRFVLTNPTPFIVPLTHGRDGFRGASVDEPIATITGAHRGEQALVKPTLAPFVSSYYGKGQGGDTRATGADAPLPTQTTENRFAVIAPHLTKFRGERAGQSVEEPMPTVTANSFIKRPGGAPSLGVVAPFLVPRYGERPGQEPRCHSIEEPTPVVVPTGNGHTLVTPRLERVDAAFLAQHNTDMVGHSPEEPLSTIVGKGCTQAVVSAGLVNMHGSDRRQSAVDEPTPAQTAGGWHQAETRAFLVKYHRDGGQFAEVDGPAPTVDCKDRHGLIETKWGTPPLSDAQIARARQVADFLRAHGFWDDREFVTIGNWLMVDIGMRMLTPRELARAQGFPDSYVIDRTPEGIPVTKTDQIRLIGNSVCPQVAEALVRANYVPMDVIETLPETGLFAIAAE